MERDAQFEGLYRLGELADDNPSSFHAKLLECFLDGVYFVDAERKIIYWNQCCEHLTGYSASEAVGRHCYDFLEHFDEAGTALCTNACPLASTIGDGQQREVEVFLRHKLGHMVPVCVRVAPIMDRSRQIVGAVGVFRDITVKKQVERRVHLLENITFRDSLTCLSSRRYIALKVN